MNAVVRMRTRFTPPFANPDPERIQPKRLVLQPIQWGKRDPTLARGVCRAIREAMPEIVIPFHPKHDRKLRTYLREHGIHH